MLHGHGHTRSLDYLQCNDGRVTPIVGMASSSSNSEDELHRAEFKLFNIENTGPNWNISMQSYTFDSTSAQFEATDIQSLSEHVETNTQ